MNVNVQQVMTMQNEGILWEISGNMVEWICEWRMSWQWYESRFVNCIRVLIMVTNTIGNTCCVHCSMFVYYAASVLNFIGDMISVIQVILIGYSLSAVDCSCNSSMIYISGVYDNNDIDDCDMYEISQKFFGYAISIMIIDSVWLNIKYGLFDVIYMQIVVMVILEIVLIPEQQHPCTVFFFFLFFNWSNHFFCCFFYFLFLFMV